MANRTTLDCHNRNKYGCSKIGDVAVGANET